MDEKKKYPNKEDEMSFSDSWKRTSVELAVGAAIVAGAADTIIKGKPTSFINGGKEAIKAVGGGLNRYIGKKGTPGQKFLAGVTRKTTRNLKNEAGKLEDFAKSELGTMKKRYENTLENENIRRRIEDDAIRNLKRRGFDNPTQDQLDLEMETLRTNRVTKSMSKQQNKKDGRFEMAKGNFLGGAATGLGLAAGITTFHNIDRQLNPGEKNKSKDTSFEIAGSLLGKGKNMNKTAGVRELYDGIAGVAGNAPKAVATGLGYTGVSLGTAKVLNDQQKKQESKEEPAKKNSRIIIELGQEAHDDNSTHATRNTSLSMLPKYKDLQKTASISNFLKNVGGRSGEAASLERQISGQTKNYRDEAASLLKGQDVNKMVGERYGNLVHKGSDPNMPYNGGQDFFHRELLDSEANRLKRVDQEKLETLKNDVAKARMQGIGGLAGLGAAGGALSSLRKDDKQNGNA